MPSIVAPRYHASEHAQSLRTRRTFVCYSPTCRTRLSPPKHYFIENAANIILTLRARTRHYAHCLHDSVHCHRNTPLYRLWRFISATIIAALLFTYHAANTPFTHAVYYDVTPPSGVAASPAPRMPSFTPRRCKIIFAAKDIQRATCCYAIEPRKIFCMPIRALRSEQKSARAPRHVMPGSAALSSAAIMSHATTCVARHHYVHRSPDNTTTCPPCFVFAALFRQTLTP